VKKQKKKKLTTSPTCWGLKLKGLSFLTTHLKINPCFADPTVVCDIISDL